MARVGGSNIEGVNSGGMSEYLDQPGVVFAVLFGSHAQGDVREASDVDVALRFPDEMEPNERFRLRNRIDATLQEYSDRFVDVSDIDSLPVAVAYAALRDGIILTGDEQVVESYREQIVRAYEDSADERERERREFIDRLARGDV